MTVIADSRERADAITNGVDQVRLLVYGDKNYSFDVLILRDNEPKALRGERKTFSDLVSSLHKLDRQVVVTDFLIVELPESMDIIAAYGDLALRAFKTLARLSLSRAVMFSTGQEMTLQIYRYLERRPNLDLRPRKENPPMDGDDFYDSLFRLVGISPTKITDQGTVGSLLRAKIKPADVGAALGLGEWGSVPGVGPKTLERASKAILGESLGE